jgi:hypothetical protein
LRTAASAHLRQIHARPRISSGTAASNSAVKVTPRHQHGVLKSPDAAAAHSFAAPHKGQHRSGKGF